MKWAHVPCWFYVYFKSGKQGHSTASCCTYLYSGVFFPPRIIFPEHIFGWSICGQFSTNGVIGNALGSIVTEYVSSLVARFLLSQEEDRAHHLWVTENETASHLSRAVRSVSTSIVESDERRKQGPCSRELKEAVLCYRTHREAGKEPRCADLVNMLEACTLSATHQRQ